MTTVSSEKSFSNYRDSKTYLRNTTGKNRLNGLAIMNIHCDLVIFIAKIINELTIKTHHIKLL